MVLYSLYTCQRGPCSKVTLHQKSEFKNKRKKKRGGGVRLRSFWDNGICTGRIHTAQAWMLDVCVRGDEEDVYTFVWCVDGTGAVPFGSNTNKREKRTDKQDKDCSGSRRVRLRAYASRVLSWGGRERERDMVSATRVGLSYNPTTHTHLQIHT